MNLLYSRLAKVATTALKEMHCRLCYHLVFHPVLNKWDITSFPTLASPFACTTPENRA